MRSCKSREVTRLLALWAAVSSWIIPRIEGTTNATTNTTTSSFSSNNSSSSSTSYLSCVAGWMFADDNQDGYLSRAEYINWLINVSPYSATKNCPNASNVNDFLGNRLLSNTFTELSCLLCRNYTRNATCCSSSYTNDTTNADDDGYLRIQLPGSSLPQSYAVTGCQIVYDALDIECGGSSNSPPSMAPSSYGMIDSSTNSTFWFNNYSTGMIPSAPPIRGTNQTQSPGDSTVNWPSTDTSTTDNNRNNNDTGGNPNSNRLQQVVLPLLLVAVAAILFAITIIFYQKRRHRLMPTSIHVDPKASAMATDRHPITGKIGSEESTDSDEERAELQASCTGESTATTVTITPIATGQSSSSSSSGSSSVPLSSRKRTSSSSSSITTIRLSSLLHSLPLDPWREETCSEDDDHTATSVSVDRTWLAGNTALHHKIRTTQIEPDHDDDEDDEEDDNDSDKDITAAMSIPPTRTVASEGGVYDGNDQLNDIERDCEANLESLDNRAENRTLLDSSCRHTPIQTSVVEKQNEYNGVNEEKVECILAKSSPAGANLSDARTKLTTLGTASNGSKHADSYDYCDVTEPSSSNESFEEVSL